MSETKQEDNGRELSNRGKREEKIEFIFDLLSDGKIERSQAVDMIVADEMQILMMAREFSNRAFKDSLTGLLNREGMMHEMSKLDTSRAEYSLLLFDVDFFKRFNDTYGHSAGDTVLQTVSAEVSTVLREVDLISRWGGEEFLIVLPGVVDSVSLMSTAERIRKKIESLPVTVRGNDGNLHSDKITISIGGTTNVESLHTFDECLTEADKTLYLAKAGGRNQSIMSE